MADIASVPPASASIPASTPSAGASSLPAEPAAAPAVPRTPEALQRRLDEMLAEADTSLRFRVDRAAQRIVVSVLDHEGAVILQIPSETALAIARRLVLTGSILETRA